MAHFCHPKTEIIKVNTGAYTYLSLLRIQASHHHIQQGLLVVIGNMYVNDFIDVLHPGGGPENETL